MSYQVKKAFEECAKLKKTSRSAHADASDLRAPKAHAHHACLSLGYVEAERQDPERSFFPPLRPSLFRAAPLDPLRSH